MLMPPFFRIWTHNACLMFDKDAINYEREREREREREIHDQAGTIWDVELFP